MASKKRVLERQHSQMILTTEITTTLVSNKRQRVSVLVSKNKNNLSGINKRRKTQTITVKKKRKTSPNMKIKVKEMPLSQQDAVTEEETESSSDYVDETSDDDSCGGSQSGASIRPGVDLDIGNTLRRILEQDYDLIMHKKKVFSCRIEPLDHITLYKICIKDLLERLGNFHLGLYNSVA